MVKYRISKAFFTKIFFTFDITILAYYESFLKIFAKLYKYVSYINLEKKYLYRQHRNKNLILLVH